MATRVVGGVEEGSLRARLGPKGSIDVDLRAETGTGFQVKYGDEFEEERHVLQRRYSYFRSPNTMNHFKVIGLLCENMPILNADATIKENL